MHVHGFIKHVASRASTLELAQLCAVTCKCAKVCALSREAHRPHLRLSVVKTKVLKAVFILMNIHKHIIYALRTVTGG